MKDKVVWVAEWNGGNTFRRGTPILVERTKRELERQLQGSYGLGSCALVKYVLATPAGDKP